ncbi:DUF6325 family protein [Streptomyces pratensis]|uniref:DUF6325 family protein n=1 Tax=Streptomyces pratensis TaxID=1169025 RepID=UPI003017FC78
MAVGPLEYLVIAFPGSRFAGAVAPVLAGAVASGAVRAGDLAYVRRTEGGALVRAEPRDLAPEADLAAGAGEGEAPELGDDDVRVLDASVPRGDAAALVVREDLWATPLARAVREAGGVFVAHERLGAQGEAMAVEGGAAETDEDIITRLERLAELWKRDVLSDAEFVQQKTKLLSD